MWCQQVGTEGGRKLSDNQIYNGHSGSLRVEIEIVIPEREDGEGPVGLVGPPVPDGHSPEVVGPHAQPPRLPGPGHVPVVDDGRHVVMDEVALETVDVDQQREDSQQCRLEASQRQKLRTS